ncbi:DUF262 domain-containing protein [Thalassotalea sp. PP2-459]|uniref:DUF262 domain-containing protein n=1 Tax=Thalassotalea sp. PP2-459 TaxID=1742724 RepID=UPI0009456F2E|nr:DUF262 domain-containing protein [Thalassotalea sp. PP2-459]OKY24975.1 hypothetical protein BI291_04460 [Thalassotalea sp. PP2-459]
MDKTTKADQFRDVFQDSLKITSRSLSVKTLLSERNLRRINYSPYYQRNYVWDNEKQSFFIESVILGTEVPPLILFKTGTKIEVIDGRQRFETLKKFKEGDFSLSSKGLKELENLSRNNFIKLPEFYSRTFLDSNIRVFEFEVINHPNLSDDIIDKVKKEIFRRYNTGITPLTRDELDNARYDTDEFSDLFKSKLQNDNSFYESFNNCFFPKAKLDNNRASIISQNLDIIRKYRILNQFPIATYASATDRAAITNILYDFTNNSSQDINEEFQNFSRLILNVIDIHKSKAMEEYRSNKLIFETILWAMSILELEQLSYTFNTEKFSIFLKENISRYSAEFSHYYGNTIARYESTANFISKELDFDFTRYIRSSDFKKDLKEKRQTAEETEKSIAELSNLRLHKPNPTSIDIDEIRGDLKHSNYLLRPTYQRQEKISHLKASSIIESILLGINLPPIFVFKRKTGIKEVVDGQQRLLSILGYLGEPYTDENGKLSFSKNNNFKLKGLKVLENLEGKRFSDLEEHLQDKILDFVIDLIIIDELKNESFDPIDLFIRLNYKPYPIKPNSFEMWNSIISMDVIKGIKEIANSKHSSWFFLREIKEGKPDRMLNEELIISLVYMYFNKDKERVIGFFPRQKTITCRLKDKKGFSEFLFNLESTAVEKYDFLRAISITKKLIELLNEVFDGATKQSFNQYLNISGSNYFRRSLQDFYVIWLILIHASEDKVRQNKDNFKADIRELLTERLNPEDKDITDDYIAGFFAHIDEIKNKYE